MTRQHTADEIRAAVSAAYGARALEVAAGNAAACCGDDCCIDGSDSSTAGRAAGVADRFYSADQAAGLPETVVSYGCGNPVAIGALQPGETVLDLGSGAGMDCFLAARQVGPAGRVIGIDMTEAMLDLAESNKAKLGVANVEFRKGLLEALPLPPASVNVIISNCVINLSPDKDAVFQESFRVLTPGGRLHVSDVVLLHALSPEEQGNLDLWAGCASGALEQTDYAARLQAAGFSDVAITVRYSGDGKAWQSALIDARKPGGATMARPTRMAGEPLELIAAPGLETAACCGPTSANPGKCC
jgi:arsenite methyltransferase